MAESAGFRRFLWQTKNMSAGAVLDLRGYGESGKPQGGKRHENYSFGAMAQDQVDVMSHCA
jgi:hypothetical protein